MRFSRSQALLLMRSMRVILIAFAASGLLTACDNSPTGPTPGVLSPVVATDPNPAPPAGPGIRSIEIEGPQVVTLGQTVQFSLIAQMTDESRRDVTNEARWSWSEFRSEPMLVLGPGLVTGHERGETQVWVEFDGYTKWKDVMVLPAGTYKLLGQVNDANVQVGGARVEVTRGVGAGLFTYTDSTGDYSLYGVSGEVRIRVTKDGYQPAVRDFLVTAHQKYDIWLPLSAPLLELSGNYTLTITAADHCGVGIGEGHVPQEARVRTFQATLRQDGSRLEVALSRATFTVPRFAGPHISARVVPGGMELSIPEYESPLVERLPSGGVLIVWGDVAAAGSANRLAGRLDGEFSTYETEDVWSSSTARCQSGSHQFVLAR